MGLDFAIDELYGTGWSSLDTAGCAYLDGRLFPGVERVTRTFADAGRSLRINEVDGFGCFRAEWSDAQGQPEGAVVGQSREEAAVYALATLRRSGARVSSAG